MKVSGAVCSAACIALSIGMLRAEENSSAAAFARVGDEAIQQGDYKKAAKSWEKAVALDSTNADYRNGLGRAYERQAEISSFPLFPTNKARQQYVRALELDPENVRAIEGLVDLAQQPVGLCEGDLREASLLIDRLAQIDPDSAKREREYWEDAKKESERLGQKALCGPVKVSRVVTDRFIPSRLVVSAKSTDRKNGSDSSVLASKDTAWVAGSSK